MSAVHAGHAAAARSKEDAWASLRALARRVHFLAGFLVAPFLLVLCLTGLVYVFSPQIHDDLYAAQLYVDRVEGAPRPVAEQVAAALAAHPEAALRSVVPPTAPDRTTRVHLSVPDQRQPGEARTVYVDPYTNYISGELTTVDGRLPANVWLRDLHADLHLGEVGRLYSETAASWLPVIAVGGLLVWIGRQGRRRRGPREFLVPAARGKGGQARLRAVHGPLGLWLTAGLLVMAVTGLMMSRFAGRRLADVRAPELAAAPVEVGPVPAPVDVDRVLAVARADGLAGELEVTPPAAADRPFTVAERSPGLPVQRDAIAVDPYTGEVTERVGWADYPLLAQVRELGAELHTGTLFGLANQILLAAFAVATIVLIVVGYRMWWARSPYRGQLRPAPPRALGRLHWPVAVPVGLLVVALGWLMPVFGAGLVAFVVLDLVINAVREERDRARRTVAAGMLVAASTVLGLVLLTPTTPVTRDSAAGPPARDAPGGGGGVPGEARPPGDGGGPLPVVAGPRQAPDAVPGAPVIGDAAPGDRGAAPGAGGGVPGTGDGFEGAPGDADRAGIALRPQAPSHDDAPVGTGPGPAPGAGGAVPTPTPVPGAPAATGAGAARQPSPAAPVGGLVGTLADVVRPVGPFLHGVVDAVTGVFSR